jgi:carboxypeptidase PM20D1
MIWLFIFVPLFVFIGFLFLRGFLLKQEEEKPRKAEPSTVAFEAAVKKFQQLIRIPTISHSNGIGEDEKTFQQFREILPQLFPAVYKKCVYQEIGRRGLLFHWKGKDNASASVFMAHYDVVPVDTSQWQKPPFDAIIEEGILWGRGTLDTKGTFTAVLETANQLIESGFFPEHDIYLAFSGEEETHGSSADDIVNHLMQQGVAINFVLDEGGAIIEPLSPVTDQRLGVIGIGEKAQMDIKLTLRGEGGHASHPPARSLVRELSEAIIRVEKSPMPVQLNKGFLQFIRTLGQHAGIMIRTIIANIHLFKPLLAMITRKIGGEINALIRTTFAVTVFNGSDTFNVMPSEVSAGLNVRYLNEDDPEKILKHLKKVIDNPKIAIDVLYDSGRSGYSDINCPQYDVLKECIRQTWQAVQVVPYLMIACSDARHYSQVSDKVYRFAAMEMTKEERKLIHGPNERIRLDEWKNTLDFYYRLMRRF